MYSQEEKNKIADAICEIIATTSRPTYKICPEIGIDYVTFTRWILADNEICNKYTRAKKCQMDFFSEEMLDIADTPKVGTKTVEKPSGKEVTEGDMTEHRKLQIETRKWLMSKLALKKYGNVIDVTSGGEPVSSTVINLASGATVKA